MVYPKKPALNYRQKTLLDLLEVFGGCLPCLDFQNYLFLYTQEFEKQPSFEFVPYKYGCFSFQSDADKRRMVEIGALVDAEDWCLSKNYVADSFFVDDAFNNLYRKYSALKGDDLLRDIYRRYPYYAIKSEIAASLVSGEELAKIKAAHPQAAEQCFFTIGYEGSSFEGYLNRLIKNNIRTLVDVRRNAFSHKYGFSQKTLSETLAKLDIEYIHIPELGISSAQRQELNIQADYDRLFASYEKNELKENQAALNNLFEIFKNRKRIAITCFEADVHKCHRGRIANVLSQRHDWQYDVRHI